jgi:hypothetical protein
MRTFSYVTGLTLLSALAFAACSTGGDTTGAAGSGAGAGGNAGGGGTGGGDLAGRGGASAGGGTGGSVAGSGGSGGATTGVAGTGGSAGQGGGAAGASGRGGSAAGSTGTAGRGGSGAAGTGGSGPAGTGGSATAGRGGSAAGGSGAFGISGPTRCDTTLPLCESFENGLDGNLWKTTKAGDATIVVDDLHAARGTKALHVKTVAGGGSNFAYIKETKTFPATNNVLYGRMFVWFEDAITTDGHFSLAEGTGTGNSAAIRFGGQFKAFGVGTDGGNSGDWTDSDRSKLVPAQTWICAEFEFDGPNNTFHVWWDDMERPTLTTGVSKHASFAMPTFNALWFGWWMYNIAEPQEVWIDEIAVDYKPIGCTK